MDFNSAAISSTSSEEVQPVPPQKEEMVNNRTPTEVIDELEKLPVINGEYSAANLRDFRSLSRRHSKATQAPSSLTSIFLGIGLCTTKELSRGLPFDVVGQLCAAEWARRILNYDKILIVVADVHAKTNPAFAGQHELIDKVAAANKNLLRDIAKALNISHMHMEIKLASEIAGSQEYVFCKRNTKSVLTDPSIFPLAKPYVHEQAATIEWARKYFGMRAKVSWLAVGNEEERTYKTHDEVFFDIIHARHFGKHAKFDLKEGEPPPKVNYFNIIGTEPGHTFWGSQPIVPPYILLGETMQIAIGEKIDCRLVVAKAIGNSERAAASFAANFSGLIKSVEMIKGQPLAGYQWVDKANSFLDLIYTNSAKRAHIRARSIDKSFKGLPERIRDLQIFEKLAGHSYTR
ncbi:MAG: hypothetical protein AB7U41_06675 [Dongiaceae bacterium]